MKFRLLVLVMAVLPMASLAQFEVGDGLLDSCDDIQRLVDAEQYAEAKEKADRCLKGIEEQLTGAVSGLFVDTVAGWSRTSLETNQAMGFSNITATYEKGAYTIDISLTGSSGSGGFGGFMSGLAQSGLMGGGRQVKVAGIPSTMTEDGTLMVPLAGNSFLTFESSDFDSADAAIDGMGGFINDFPVADINAALQ